jgi:tetratricopeptide (TPR) repeat protein
MTHYELLGIRPEAPDSEVLEAILAARSSWERRRDASATEPAALARATSALSRLDEAARDLGTSETRQAYDEANLTLEVLTRIRILRSHGTFAVPESPSGSPVTPDEAAEQARRETEQAIRAEAERRRELRRQDEERERLARESIGNSLDGAVEPPDAVETRNADPASDLRAERSWKPVKGRKGKARFRLPEIDWRAVAILSTATTIGLGIALVPIALVTSQGGLPKFRLTWPGLDPASDMPRVLPTFVAATAAPPVQAPARQAVHLPSPAAVAPATATLMGRAGFGAHSVSASASVSAAESAPMSASASESVSVSASGSESGLSESVSVSGSAPESAQSILRRAYAAYGAGRYQESLTLYDQVLAQRRDDPMARVARALTFLAMNRPHDAEVECRIAIKVQPTFPEAHFNLGVALHRQKRDAEAVAAFNRFVELAPEDRAAPQARGFIARYNLARQAPRSRQP